MWNRIKALVWKEFLQLRRDRMTLAFTLGMPLMQLIIFGFAINYDVKHMPAAVLDESRSQESRSFVDGLVATQYFDVKAHVASEAELRAALDRGRAQVGVWFPPDYARRIRSGLTGEVMILVDGSSPTTAGSAMSTAAGVGQLRNTQLLYDRMGYGGAAKPVMPVEVRIRPWYNPDLRSPTFIVPGLVGVILSMTCIMFAANAIVREKERGTLDQVLVTPVTPMELFAGKIIPVVVMAYAQMTVLFGVAHLFFDVPVAGSVILLYLMTGLFIVAMLGIGIRISTTAQSQGQSAQMSMLTFLPFVFLSGYIFPREGMPLPFFLLGEIMPLTHFLIIIRAVVLRGAGLEAFWPEVLKLLGLSAVIWTMALRSMKRAEA
ncbi:transport permease protein [Geothrix oryzae]|uniref:Transport permease protein n=1 Tax=Geothrix oryzae TaxID=2927975 RepID=A0ABN6UXH6_9BACT|nr:ABC transporter permease [Geothrix oryzae]BDU69549.1 transport permease protein [Geothrix oryzae]